MSDASVQGKVHVIEETKTYGQNGFQKRLVVLEQENDRFTNYIPLEFIRDACAQVDEMKVGDQVEVRYRLSGRKWQKDPSSEVRYFVNAEASGFRVLKEGETGGQLDEEAANRALAEAAGDDGDVPF
jgi:uncharacterized protein DUF3127